MSSYATDVYTYLTAVFLYYYSGLTPQPALSPLTTPEQTSAVSSRMYITYHFIDYSHIVNYTTEYMYSSSHSIFVYHITGEDPTNQPVSEVGSDQHNEDIHLKEENSLQETLPSDKTAHSEETSLLEEPDSGGICNV